MDAIARTVDQDRGRSVHDIPRGDLLAARLQHPAFWIIEPDSRWTAENGERRPHAHVDIDVGGTVQRVEDDGVVGILRIVVHQDRLFVFFGRQHPDALAYAQKMGQRLVGIHIKLLLELALHVDVAVHSENVGQTGPPHLSLDQFGGHRDPRQQHRELAGRSGTTDLVLQNVLLDGNDRRAIR